MFPQHADQQSFDHSQITFPERETSAQLLSHGQQPQTLFDSGIVSQHVASPAIIHQQPQPQSSRGPPGRPLIKPNRRPTPAPAPPVEQIEEEQTFDDDDELSDDFFDLPLHQMQQQVL